MAIQSGIGDHVLYSGVDVSGDIQQLTLGAPLALIDKTNITQPAHARMPGLADGSLNLTTYFDPAAGAIHSILSKLATTDVVGTYCRGFGVGMPSASLVALETSYDGTRATDGSLLFKTALPGDRFGLDWGVQLTNGYRTDTTATTGTGFDNGLGLTTPAIPATTVPVTNTGSIPATVVITGGTMTNVSINGVTVGTGAGTYTLPAGGTITLTYTAAPTWTWTLQTANGFQAFLHVASFTGTSAVVKLQDSADNTTFTDVASAAFTAVTSTTPQAQRIAVGGTAAVRRYVRVSTTGTFSNVSFWVQLSQNSVAVTF